MNGTKYKIRHLSLVKVIISLIMTIVLWAIVSDAWGYSRLLLGAQRESWTSYGYHFVSRFVWAIPAIVLLRLYAKDIPTYG